MHLQRNKCYLAICYLNRQPIQYCYSPDNFSICYLALCCFLSNKYVICVTFQFGFTSLPCCVLLRLNYWRDTLCHATTLSHYLRSWPGYQHSTFAPSSRNATKYRIDCSKTFCAVLNWTEPLGVNAAFVTVATKQLNYIKKDNVRAIKIFHLFVPHCWNLSIAAARWIQLLQPGATWAAPSLYRY